MYTEPRETRQIKQYWTSFFSASKANGVSKRASLLAEKMHEENITASVESLLTKIERTPVWSGSYLTSVGLDKDEAAIVTDELKKQKAVKSSKEQGSRKGNILTSSHLPILLFLFVWIHCTNYFCFFCVCYMAAIYLSMIIFLGGIASGQ